MIINSNNRQADSVSIGIEESINMTIDTSSQAALMMILSENLYKDPIGSLIRESASNALDAQREAGVNEPIIVTLEKDRNYNIVYKVQDFGTGISPDRVQNILSKYAASTKRNSNDYLGYYGLGFKAPLAYTDSFTFITVVDGKEYTYMMYKGEEGTKIDLIQEKNTDSRNGTTVIVQVKGSYDQSQFLAKIKEQLAYFEGIYFNLPNFNNDFKIIKNKDWKYSSLIGPGTTYSTTVQMHICLENVYYAIDWPRLGLNPINIPIGLNFSINDGLMPVPSREDIKYTEETKELIKMKIAWVADYFINKFNESTVEVEYIGDIIGKFKSTTVTIEDIPFNINDLMPLGETDMQKPTLKGVKVLDVERLCNKRDDWFANYIERGKISNRTFSGKYENHLPDLLDTRYTRILANTAPKGVELEYLKDRYPVAYFVYKTREKRLEPHIRFSWSSRTRGNYYDLLGLKSIAKEQWREAIKEWISIEKSITDRLLKIEDLKPTPEWLEERKNNRKKGTRAKLDDGVINIKWGYPAKRGNKQISFGVQSVQTKVKSLKSLSYLTIYGTSENKEMFDKIVPFLGVSYKQKVHSKKLGRTGPRVKFILLNKHDIKRVKVLQNFISIEDFMKGETKPFKAFATGILINKLINEQDQIFRNESVIRSLSTDFADKMVKLQSYALDNYPTYYYGDEDLFEEILHVAEDHNLWDYTIYDTYKEISGKIGIFDFIKVMRFNNDNNDLAVNLAKELLKARRFRMNWQNYVTLNPDITEIPKEILDEEADEILSDLENIEEEVHNTETGVNF